MSLLTVVQNVAQAVSINKPTVALTSTDLNIQQLCVLVNEAGQELVRKWPWQQLVKSFSFASTGTLNQGYAVSVFGSDYDHTINQTMWDTSLKQPIDGPITMQQWQQQLAAVVFGPPYCFIEFANQLWIGPSGLPLNDVVTGFYVSNQWVTGAASAQQTGYILDSDVANIPEMLLQLDVEWRWRNAKGLPYAEHMKTAERNIELYISQNTPKRVLFLGGRNILYPANIPEGFWPGT